MRGKKKKKLNGRLKLSLKKKKVFLKCPRKEISVSVCQSSRRPDNAVSDRRPNAIQDAAIRRLVEIHSPNHVRHRAMYNMNKKFADDLGRNPTIIIGRSLVWALPGKPVRKNKKRM